MFECAEEVMEARLLERGKSSGRADDNAASIKKRFATYSQETLPVLQYYEQVRARGGRGAAPSQLRGRRRQCRARGVRPHSQPRAALAAAAAGAAAAAARAHASTPPRTPRPAPPAQLGLVHRLDGAKSVGSVYKGVCRALEAVHTADAQRRAQVRGARMRRGACVRGARGS